MFKDKDKIPRRVQFKWIEGDPASVDAMRHAGLEEAHALIIGGSTSATPKEADAYTLTTITLAQARLPPAVFTPWGSSAALTATARPQQTMMDSALQCCVC